MATRKYKTLTREYTVTNDGVMVGCVLIIGRLRQSGAIVEATVVGAGEMPGYINNRRAVIQPEELRGEQ